jgi:glycerophosphoryl diester phosphodiesterase
MLKERPPGKSPLRIGHRGAAGHAPENTLASVRKAIEFGVDVVEVDLRLTRDGQVVLLHDATVDRTTSGKGRVSAKSLEGLKALAAGGEPIPTLDELLDLARGRVGLMLEMKVAGIAERVVTTVRRSRFAGTVIYASFLHKELVAVRNADPQAAILALFDKLPKDPVSVATRLKASHVGLRFPTATAARLDTFHRAGLLVFVYTLNDPRDIQAMRALGVDGIISDFPDRV